MVRHAGRSWANWFSLKHPNIPNTQHCPSCLLCKFTDLSFYSRNIYSFALFCFQQSGSTNCEGIICHHIWDANVKFTSLAACSGKRLSMKRSPLQIAGAQPFVVWWIAHRSGNAQCIKTRLKNVKTKTSHVVTVFVPWTSLNHILDPDEVYSVYSYNVSSCSWTSSMETDWPTHKKLVKLRCFLVLQF